MTQGQSAGSGAWLIPPRAREEWLALTAALRQHPDVPCRTADPADWWPDGTHLDGPATHGAVAGCHRCPVEASCLSYALAADERFGVWGGTLPEERRRSMR